MSKHIQTAVVSVGIGMIIVGIAALICESRVGPGTPAPIPPPSEDEPPPPDLRGPVTVSFSRGRSMPEPRSHGDATLCDDVILYVGGAASTGEKLDSMVVYDPKANSWTTRHETGLTPRTGFGIAFARGDLYAAGGYSTIPDVDVFESLLGGEQSWRPMAPMPNRCNSLSGSVVALDGKVFVVGGNLFGQDRDTIQIYDPQAPVGEQWTLSARMLRARRGAAVAVCDGKIYVIGSGGNATPTVEAYDPSGDTWERKCDLPASRANAEAVTVAGRIYVIGGQGKRFDEVWRYVPEDDAWTTVGRIPADAFRGMMQAVAVGHKVYLMGGYDYDAKTCSDRVDVMTIRPGATSTARLPRPAVPAGPVELPAVRSALGCAVAQDAVWIAAGSSGPGAHREVWSFSPTDQRFVKRAPLPAPRRGLGLVAAGDGLYAIGGTPDPVSANNVFKYDIGTDKWTEVAPMTAARANFGSAVVGNRIYVFGGDNNGWPTTSAEMYDVDADEWKSVAPLPYKAYALSAIAAADGRIYLFGCNAWRQASRGKEYTDVLIYDPVKDSYVKGASSPNSHPYAGAALLGDDEILVVGGGKAIDVYDWRKDQWREAKQLPTGRSAAGVATFAGKLWIMGGETSQEGYASSVLAYELASLQASRREE